MKLKSLATLLFLSLPISVMANTQSTQDKFNDALFERDMAIAESFKDLSGDHQNGMKICYTYNLLKEKHNFVKKNPKQLENSYSLQKVILSEKSLIAQFESIMQKNKIPCETD